MKRLLLLGLLFGQTLFAVTGPNYIDHAAMAGTISHEPIEKIC